MAPNILRVVGEFLRGAILCVRHGRALRVVRITAGVARCIAWLCTRRTWLRLLLSLTRISWPSVGHLVGRPIASRAALAPRFAAARSPIVWVIAGLLFPT